MNTTHTIKVTDGEAVVGVATARLLLQHAINTEEQKQSEEDPDRVRKLALNKLTGATIHLLPKVPAEAECIITTKPSKSAEVVHTKSAYD